MRPLFVVPWVSALLTLAACHSDCPVMHCPAVGLAMSFAVTDGPDGGLVGDGIEATLTAADSSTMTMQCQGGVCFWPSQPVVAGIYSLEVTAPGFQPTKSNEEVKISHPGCGCQEASFDPSKVALNRS